MLQALLSVPDLRTAPEVLRRLVAATVRMPATTRARFADHLAHVYGDLGGQRAVDLGAVREWAGADPDLTAHDLIAGIQTAFALVADLLAAGAAHADSAAVVGAWARLPGASFKGFLRRLASGEVLAQRGIVASEATESNQNFYWYVDALDAAGLAAVRALVERIGAQWDSVATASTQLDPLHGIYTTLMPKNLLHVLGEVYTPGWLAELALEDAQWRPGQTLIDPFGGSGIFALAALRSAIRKQVDPLTVLPDLCLVDINPLACIAARTNLVLSLASALRGDHRAEVVLPVRHGDSLASNQQSQPADVLVTNPPWVGWEYIARPYRSSLEPAWAHYGLFTAKGCNASFSKEDLSTLALVTAWDRYLVDGGRSVVVLRANTMVSTLAGQGLRRLSLFPQSSPMRLEQVRLFTGMRVFPGAVVETATWQLTKGTASAFPVPVVALSPSEKRWQPDAAATLEEIRAYLTTTTQVAERVTRDDETSRWLIGSAACAHAARALAGDNAYVGRTGVFTGGANAVYYLRPDGAEDEHLRWYRNVTEGAKRAAPSVRVQLEHELVYEVVRGRDLTRWHARSGVSLLFPHSRATRMHALPMSELAASHPRALAYLDSMRAILDQRKGFTEWERAFQAEAFYAIQRVGDYTFAPYKVAWRYIANDFLCAVIGPDDRDRPRLPNDKVMFVGVADPAEAFYLCGLLSSDPIRWKVMAYVAGTQISASAIAPLAVARFDPHDDRHRTISEACRAGHIAVSTGAQAEASGALTRINRATAALFRFDDATMRSFRDELTRALSDWPRLERSALESE